MKTQNEIEDRIRSLLAEERDRRVAESRERLPRLCAHNHQQPLDSRRQVEGEPNETFNRITTRVGLPVVQTMGLCMLGSEHPEDWQGTICEDPIDAQRCPVFNPKESPEAIEAAFRQQMQDDAWVRANFPEVNALLWALDTPGLPPEPVPSSEPEEPPVPLPWWKRVLVCWLLGVPAHGTRILPAKDE